MNSTAWSSPRRLLNHEALADEGINPYLRLEKFCLNNVRVASLTRRGHDSHWVAVVGVRAALDGAAPTRQRLAWRAVRVVVAGRAATLLVAGARRVGPRRRR